MAGCAEGISLRPAAWSPQGRWTGWAAVDSSLSVLFALHHVLGWKRNTHFNFMKGEDKKTHTFLRPNVAKRSVNRRQPVKCLLPLYKREFFTGKQRSQISPHLEFTQTCELTLNIPLLPYCKCCGSLADHHHHLRFWQQTHSWFLVWGTFLSNIQKDSALLCKLMMVISPKFLVFMKICYVGGTLLHRAVPSHGRVTAPGPSALAPLASLCRDLSPVSQQMFSVH